VSGYFSNVALAVEKIETQKEMNKMKQEIIDTMAEAFEVEYMCWTDDVADGIADKYGIAFERCLVPVGWEYELRFKHTGIDGEMYETTPYGVARGREQFKFMAALTKDEKMSMVEEAETKLLAKLRDALCSDSPHVLIWAT
jgi:hypothetical protein